MFIANVEWIDDELNSDFDTLLLPARDWVEAVGQIKEYFQEDLAVIHYLEPWENILVVDDDLICDMNTIRNRKRE